MSTKIPFQRPVTADAQTPSPEDIDRVEANNGFILAAIDNMADGIRVFDKDLKLVAFNKMAIELSMYPEHLFQLGTPYEEFLSFSETRGQYLLDDSIVADRIKRVRSGEQRNKERRLPDGRFIRKTRCPIPGGGLVSTYTDITELKQAQESAADQAELLTTVVESINHGVRAIGPDGELLLWNKRYQQIFDYPEKLLKLGTPYAEITRFNSARSGRSEADIESRVRERLKRNRLQSRLNRVKKYRDDLVIHQNMEPLPGGGFITTYTDITDLAKARDQLIEEKQRAELANRSKSEFLANMSHELRTPLNAIIGFSELIKNELRGPIGTACYKNYAADIFESGKLLLQLLNDILDISKIEAGVVTTDVKTMNLAANIHSCMSIVQGRAKDARVRIEAELAEPLPQLSADPRMMKQILLNLLSNSIKFTEPGGSARIDVRVDQEGWLNLSVSDTGIGIPQEQISSVLEPFTQIENTLTKRHSGTGLGLAIVRSLVELHNGNFYLESTLGEGTTAIVRMPPERLIVPSA